MTMRDMVPFGRNRTRQTPARRGRLITPFDRFHDEIDRLFEDFFPSYQLANLNYAWIFEERCIILKIAML